MGKVGGTGGGAGPGGRLREGDLTVTVWGRRFALGEMESFWKLGGTRDSDGWALGEEGDWEFVLLGMRGRLIGSRETYA